MFVILTVALWLRPLSHAYWAAGVTTALSLLLGCFGQDVVSLLPTRLAATAVGATLFVAAAWWLLSVQRPKRGQVGGGRAEPGQVSVGRVLA
ncbi:hypothetical protein AV521_33985 [Streptomyces sp. IMTB 2501]|uniref:hypothetical protein n=1 Tax=Streptomyces sp. IMTB 2501 TaxID=1776340 RepID=UPI00096F8FBE|nr:hypothetical protein [Streptomyces sp. IMTB 2501]OLZ64964.1 hypothetical protein AV521_33985 [Streptomyces sp. IMTB 2501]